MVSKEQIVRAMSRALLLADRARSTGDVPVGAVVLDRHGNVIAQGWNQREALHDPCAHAEIMALRQAGDVLKRWNLADCTLVVTLEPCTMCAGAISAARIDLCVFGAWDPKAGAAGSLRDVLRDTRMNHQVKVWGGVLEDQAQAQLHAFFEQQRRAGQTTPDQASQENAASSMNQSTVSGARAATGTAASTAQPAASTLPRSTMNTLSRPRSWERSERILSGGGQHSKPRPWERAELRATKHEETQEWEPGERRGRVAGASSQNKRSPHTQDGGVSASQLYRSKHSSRTTTATTQQAVPAITASTAHHVSPSAEDIDALLRMRVASLPRVRVRQHHVDFVRPPLI